MNISSILFIYLVNIGILRCLLRILGGISILHLAGAHFLLLIPLHAEGTYLICHRQTGQSVIILVLEADTQMAWELKGGVLVDCALFEAGEAIIVDASEHCEVLFLSF